MNTFWTSPVGSFMIIKMNTLFQKSSPFMRLNENHVLKELGSLCLLILFVLTKSNISKICQFNATLFQGIKWWYYPVLKCEHKSVLQLLDPRAFDIDLWFQALKMCLIFCLIVPNSYLKEYLCLRDHHWAVNQIFWEVHWHVLKCYQKGCR